MNNIDELMQKYWAGETSVSEENSLKTYFSSGNIAEKWKKYQPLFVFLDRVQEEKMPLSKPKVIKLPNYTRWYQAVAVIVLPLLCLIGYWSYQNYKEEQKVRLAYVQTQKAIELVGNQLNEGLSRMTYLNTFEKTKNKIANLENNN